MTDLRPITLPNDQRIVPIDQPAPMLEWLDVEKLVVDDTYQRALGKANWSSIRKIASEFRWSRFTPVLVAPIEGGRYAIIDGQHRTHAAAMCSIPAVPCMVVHMTAAEQASAFSWVNGNVTAITGFHVYKAALAAMETWALECRDAVEAAGCRLMTYPASSTLKKAGEIYTPALIRANIEAGRKKTVTRALAAIRPSDQGNHEFYSNSILKPWFEVVRHCDYSDDVLAAFCAETDLVMLLDNAITVSKTPEYRHRSRYVITEASMRVRLNHFARGAA